MLIPTSVGHFPDQLGLPRDWDLAIAGQGRHDALVPQVLAPSLELFDRPAVSLPKDRQCSPETVRVEVGEPGSDEGLTEDPANRGRRAPVLALQARDLELAGRLAHLDLRGRKQRIVGPPLQVPFKLVDPFDDNPASQLADGKEECRDSLAELLASPNCRRRDQGNDGIIGEIALAAGGNPLQLWIMLSQKAEIG